MKEKRNKSSQPIAAQACEPSQAINMIRDGSVSEFQQISDTGLSAVVSGAISAKAWREHRFGVIGINEAMKTTKETAATAASGDLDAAKEMLMAQAATLDAIFNDMTVRAAGLIRKTDSGGWAFTASTMDSLMRIAFKAQGQCRATLQTLGELVNPRSVAFVKQINNANGPQQVNNGRAPEEKSERGENKLLEGSPSERLDFGEEAEAGREDQVLEAVGQVHRTTH